MRKIGAMNATLHAARLHGTASSPAGSEDAWPGDEYEVDWGGNWSQDLRPAWRVGVALSVLLTHALLAWLVLGHEVAPSQDAQPRLIAAQVLSEAAPAAPRAEPAPAPPRPSPSPSPSPRPIQDQAAARPQRPVPAATPAPVLATPQTDSRTPAVAVPSPAARSPNPAPPPQQPQQQPPQQPALPSQAQTAPQATASPANATPSTAPRAESSGSTAEPKELPSSEVRYLYQPKKVYPRASQEMGETGVVKLRVLVDEEGHPRTVQIIKSSGFPRLDRQAIQTMNATRFQPHTEGGVPRAVWASIDVTFQLD